MQIFRCFHFLSMAKVCVQLRMFLRPSPGCLLLTFLRRYFCVMFNSNFMLIAVGVSCRISYSIRHFQLNPSLNPILIMVKREKFSGVSSRYSIPVHFSIYLPCQFSLFYHLDDPVCLVVLYILLFSL